MWIFQVQIIVLAYREYFVNMFVQVHDDLFPFFHVNLIVPFKEKQNSILSKFPKNFRTVNAFSLSSANCFLYVPVSSSVFESHPSLSFSNSFVFSFNC